MPPVVRRGVGCSCRVSGAGASPWPRHHARPGERSRRKTRGTKLILREACAWPHGSGRRHGFRWSAERKAPVRERRDSEGKGEAADEGGRSPRLAGAAGGDGRRQAHGTPETGRRDRAAARAAEADEACRDGSGGCPEARAGADGGEAQAGGGKAAAAILRRLAAASDPLRRPVEGGPGGGAPQAKERSDSDAGGRKLAISARYLRAWPAQRAGNVPLPARYPAGVAAESSGARGCPKAKRAAAVSRAGAGGRGAPATPRGASWEQCSRSLSDCLDHKLPLGSAVAEP